MRKIVHLKLRKLVFFFIANSTFYPVDPESYQKKISWMILNRRNRQKTLLIPKFKFTLNTTGKSEIKHADIAVSLKSIRACKYLYYHIYSFENRNLTYLFYTIMYSEMRKTSRYWDFWISTHQSSTVYRAGRNVFRTLVYYYLNLIHLINMPF